MSGLLQNYVDGSARRQPDATALVLGEERWSYRDVAAFSDQVAGTLATAGCGRGDRVAFVLPKCPRTIAAMIGILKAGCAYVPIDPASPPARASAIVRSADPKVILTDGSHSFVLAEPVSATILDISKLPPSERDCIDVAVRSEDMAYILYTSGSTGIPKGVVITHANVTSFIEWAVRYFDLTAGDRLSGHPPLHFDLSVFDIFGTFAAGAELHLAPGDINLSAPSAASFIRSSRLSQWFSVPSLMTYMAKFDAIAFGDFPRSQACTLVRRSAADSRVASLDGSSPSRPFYESVWTHRSDDRQQLFHPRRDRRSRPTKYPSGNRVLEKPSSSWMINFIPFLPVKQAICL